MNVSLERIKAVIERQIGKCFARHKMHQPSVTIIEIVVESVFCWSEEMSDRDILERVACDLEEKAAALRRE